MKVTEGGMTVRKLLGGAAGVIAMAGMAVPAQAQQWHPERKRHHDDKFDTGDAIVGGLIVGGLIALISSSKKKAQPVETYEDVPPPETHATVDNAPPPPEPGAYSGPIEPTPAPDSARFDGLY